MGAGLVATADVRTGDLLLAVPPLVVAYGPEQQIPEQDAVREQLRSALPDLDAAKLRWLQLLARDRGRGAAEAGGGAERNSAVPEGEDGDAPSVLEQCQELQQLLDGSWHAPAAPQTEAHSPLPLLPAPKPQQPGGAAVASPLQPATAAAEAVAEAADGPLTLLPPAATPHAQRDHPQDPPAQQPVSSTAPACRRGIRATVPHTASFPPRPSIPVLSPRPSCPAPDVSRCAPSP